MAQVSRIDPATRFVRRLGEEFFKLREAAQLLDISERTLRNLLRGEHTGYKPSYVADLGKVRIYLYTREDIERIRQLLDTRYSIKPNKGQIPMGRPAIYTTEERVVRQRQYSMAHYYRKRYESLSAAGKVEKAQVALEKMREYEDALKEAKK